ncbi:MAG TPA: FtsX-like permease family protein, partial [Acidimicrobiales bacterium]|nr:FtsX-like permease family protein [Acidimicrobiales bacterium]
MFRATIKGLLAYKLRLALTAIAVVLGVSFVVGTYVLSDTITGFFDKTFAEANKGTDIVVSTGSAGGAIQDAGDTLDTENISATVFDTVKHVPGVEVAEGNVQGSAQMLDKKGKPYGGLGPPTLGLSWATYAPFSPLRLRSGRAPKGPDDVVIDAVSARKMGYAVGDQIKVIPNGPVRTFSVVGIVGFGKADNLGGATIVSWSLPVAQEVFKKGTAYDGIAVKVAPGHTVNDVIASIQDAIGPHYKVQSGAASAKEGADAINQGVKIFTTGILFFAGIALFVGAFIIANTFSIIVAQRSRELALLRSIGASRTQILSSVLVEAAVVGVVASAVGIVAGLGIGAGLRALVNALSGGGGLPGAYAGLKARTIILGFAVGTITTLVSALFPALRASRQPPIAALRQETHVAASHFTVRRLTIGVVASAVAVALLGYGMYGNDVALRFLWIVLGAFGVFLGIAMLSPLVVRPIAGLLGAPMARASMPGTLARENSRRNPQRTASTAAALMIGIAVVAAVATLGSSIDKSLHVVLDRTVKAQVIVNNNQGPIDPAVEQRVMTDRDVVDAVPLRYNEFKYAGKKRTLLAMPPDKVAKVFDLEVQQGSFADLAQGGVLLHKDIAKTLHKGVGDTLPMGFPGAVRNEVVRGIFGNNQVTNASYMVSLAEYQQVYTEQEDAVVFVLTKPGASPAVVAHRLDTELKPDYPQIDVLDQKGFADQQAGQIRGLLNVVSAMLLLSIIIALLGIANTLALSVFERTREIGLLRAIGTSRRQTRRMIRYESIIIAVLGAALGIVIGLAFGSAAVGALRDSGLTQLSFPVGTVIVVLLLSGFAGVGAAFFPARRAANLNVLDAIAAA